MKINRRQALLSTLFGTGYVGLRALATGLPAGLLLNPREALANVPRVPQATCTAPQFVIFSTSGDGDSLNTHTPGTYDDPAIVHSLDPQMVATPFTMAGQSVKAALPWSTLPQNVLDRMNFWHTMSGTGVHPDEPTILKLGGATLGGEMLPSILSQQLAPCLNTIQNQPITLGAKTPLEALTLKGQALPIIPALALKATLTSPMGPLQNLQPLRDQSLNKLYAIYKNEATPAQKTYIDSLVTSQTQARSINQALLNTLSQITDNTPASQILAAITLIQMKVTPVIAIHIPFGGDNHTDPSLVGETQQTVAGVATIASLMAQLATAGLQDQVTFTTLNVFGRTMATGTENGRDHNPNHQVSITIGKGFKGGVIGGVTNVATDYGCTAISSTTGASSASGDISAANTLTSYAQTLLAATGVPAAAIPQQITTGKIVKAALAS